MYTLLFIMLMMVLTGANYYDASILWGLAFIPFAMLISLVLLILYVVGRWKLFEKAGEEGWKALIPFYSYYTYVKIATKKSDDAVLYFLLSFVPVLGPILIILLDYKFAGLFTSSFWLQIIYCAFKPIVSMIFAFSNKYQYDTDRVYDAIYRN